MVQLARGFAQSSEIVERLKAVNRREGICTRLIKQEFRGVVRLHFCIKTMVQTNRFQLASNQAHDPTHYVVHTVKIHKVLV